MEELEKINGNLISRGFKSRIVTSLAEAREAALSIIGGGSVGMGGSLTVEQCALYDALAARGNAVFWHWKGGPAAKEGASRADYYVCSANAVTEDGVIVLTDGSGNRISALTYGPRNAILIVGANKAVRDIPAALSRIRSARCAGANARRLGLSTPCALTGECSDCSSPERICSVTAFFERPPKDLREFFVILVREEAGM